MTTETRNGIEYEVLEPYEEYCGNCNGEGRDGTGEACHACWGKRIFISPELKAEHDENMRQERLEQAEYYRHGDRDDDNL